MTPNVSPLEDMVPDCLRVARADFVTNFSAISILRLKIYTVFRRYKVL